MFQASSADATGGAGHFVAPVKLFNGVLVRERKPLPPLPAKVDAYEEGRADQLARPVDLSTRKCKVDFTFWPLGQPQRSFQAVLMPKKHIFDIQIGLQANRNERGQLRI